MKLQLGSLIVITGLLANCGGETTSDDTALTAQSGNSSAPANACALLPASEVSTVIGESVRDSLALNMTGADGIIALSQCNYATTTNPAAASLMLRQSAVTESVSRALEAVRETITQSGVTAEDVSGLGDGALWGGNQLHVVSNKGWTIVVSPPAAGGLTQARAIAERALARM